MLEDLRARLVNEMDRDFASRELALKLAQEEKSRWENEQELWRSQGNFMQRFARFIVSKL